MKHDDTPSCLYYAERPCDRPRDCPVHRPILARPTKKTHLLSADRKSPRWRDREYLATVCGIFLHEHLPKGASVWSFEERNKWECERAARWPPHPSDVPGVSVYYVIGWDRREVLTVESGATCKRCAKVR